MKKLELKRDPMVIVPYTLFTLALLAFFAWKKITWIELVAGLGFLNVPAVFGMTKGSSSTNGILLLVVFIFGSSACASGMSEKEKAAAADSTYTAEQLRCVDDATTLEESRACRQKVREKWAAKDGGAR